MTFTEWVPEVEPDSEIHSAVSIDDARELGRMLRYLHDALRPYDRELGGSRELRDDIERLLGQLRPADARQRAAISSLGERLNALGPVVFESSLPTQALHGDISLRNLLRTRRRLVWNDFEDTFRGPVHWDVASAVGSLRIRGADTRCVREMLDAYKAAAAAAGVTPPRAHALQRDVFVTDDRERDWAMLLPELRYMRRQYGGWSFPQEADETVPAYLERLESDIEAKLKNLIIGDAAHVAARLREFELLGFDLIVCRSQFGNLPRASLRRAIKALSLVRELVAK